jgi:mRNA m6A methyltransferase non-catalytic subunit
MNSAPSNAGSSSSINTLDTLQTTLSSYSIESKSSSTRDSSRTLDYSHNFGNDYNDHYLHSGVLPQFHIMNNEEQFVGYPKLIKLHQLKEAHNKKFAGSMYGCRVPPSQMPHRLNEWTSQGVNFDVVMINGCINSPPSYQTLISLPIQKITPRPSILFLWVSGPQLEVGRLALEHWGFRRSEDIVYFANSSESVHFPKGNAASPDDCVVKTTWHCLMGLKGTLRRSDDTELINCNVDTDVILESEMERPNVIPEAMYKIVENFSLMSRRLHIIPACAPLEKPVRLRKGWVIMSPDVFLDNFEPSRFQSENSTYGYRVPVDAEIDNLRPKTPTKVKKWENN